MMKKVAKGNNTHVVGLLGCVTIEERLVSHVAEEFAAARHWATNRLVSLTMRARMS